MGTERLYRWAHRNSDLALQPVSSTHHAAVLVGLDAFVAVNAALEVDLSGQLNAKSAGGLYLGGAGGQPDFARAAANCDSGLSITGLESMTNRAVSRTVHRIVDATVRTPRHDCDVVGTEHGTADLRGKTLAERRELPVAIADPMHRAVLAAATTGDGSD